MTSKYFNPFPPDLTPTERMQRQKRQRQAEWGVAVAALGGTTPAPLVLADLQRYIDGELSLEEVSRLTNKPAPLSAAYQAVVTRARLADE